MFAGNREEPQLVAAQVRALAKQVPILYAILSIDAVAVSYTHYGVAPDWLTIYPLAVLLVACATRMLIWMRRSRESADPERGARRLRSTTRIAPILGFAFAIWAILLSRYGDATTELHAAYFLNITMIACVFCLLHLRSAAILLGMIAIPITVYFGLSQNHIVQATAVNFATVFGVLMFMQSTFYRDFRSLVRLSGENARLANIDALTGLPNRRFFFSELKTQSEEAVASGSAFTVGMIDLDGFKPVNDTYGHRAGDEVLCEVARRLELAIQDVGWVARLGGDEFGLIIKGSANIAAVGQTICVALQRPYLLREATAQIGASMGFASYTEPSDTAEILVEKADYALYFAKANHRGTAVAFTQEHASRLRSESKIEQAFREAEFGTEFDLVYQPIIDTRAGRVVAFEALARWDSMRLGPVSPADFIPVAERAGLIHCLTQALLGKALVTARNWPAEIQLAFNLSAYDIDTPEKVSMIADLITKSGVNPERIIFEVTESALMRDFADAARALTALKDLGVSIALDDFGTGFSSLSYVHRLPLDKLKVDRSFTRDLCNDAACRDIVQSIVGLCRSLDLTCVVEGVETAEQMLLLGALGCTNMQGYLFHKPMAEAEIATFLAAQSAHAVKGSHAVSTAA
jgi:diguanylate cyclase (GGDEF)-like protein